MAQNVVDFSDNPTGAELMDDYLAKDQQNVLTSNSGIQRPSYAVAGTKWLDTSANPWVWKMYDGTNDVSLGTVNPSTHLFTPAGVLPSQEGQSGKFLQTNGSNTVWTDAVDYTNITNCITKIPQDIKLELNNGTLTLKAGSKVYKGDGTYYTVQSDVTYTATWANSKLMLLYNGNGLGETAYVDKCYSGDSEPQSVSNGSWWFDTQNKIMKTYNNGWASKPHTTLPLGIISATSSGITSIDQIFNGFGYIGSTIFALPGVEGLIPNGRNTDGSLNNKKAVISTVVTSTKSSAYNGNLAIGNNFVQSTSYTEYDTINNINLTSSNERYPYAYVGKCNRGENGRITSFNPKTAFHAVDYNDYAREVDNTVHKTGNETISGRKTFSGSGIGIVKSGSAIDIQNKNVDLSVTDGSISGTTEIHLIDKNGKVQGIFEHQNRTNGDSVIIMAARNHANTAWTTLECGFDANDTIFTHAPHPSSSSNKDDIATTYWVRQYGAQLNYSAAITISGTGNKTASVNGVLIGTPIYNNRSEQLKIIIDGKTFYFSPGNSGEDNNHMSQCYLPISAGKTYNVMEINKNVQLLLVPYV